jgi:hypothetical protein
MSRGGVKRGVGGGVLVFNRPIMKWIHSRSWCLSHPLVAFYWKINITVGGVGVL